MKRRNFIKQAAAVATAAALTPAATDAEKLGYANKRVIGRLRFLPGEWFADGKLRSIEVPIDEKEVVAIPIRGTGMVYCHNGEHRDDELAIGMPDEYAGFMRLNGKSMSEPPVLILSLIHI